MRRGWGFQSVSRLLVLIKVSSPGIMIATVTVNLLGTEEILLYYSLRKYVAEKLADLINFKISEECDINKTVMR
jgi:hypothetical protein